MFEAIAAIAAAWREILHISELTGLSIGALAGMAALVWFDPALLRPVVKAAVVLAIGYACLLYGIHVGASDTRAEWDSANARAEKARVERDASIERAIEARYLPQFDELNDEYSKLKGQADDYEKQVLALRSAPPAGAAPAAAADRACELGPEPLRLRKNQPR